MIAYGIAAVISAAILGFAAWKMHAIRDRRLILAAVRNALKDRRSLWIGIALGVCYFAVFMILGGKGGRIHVLFGRLVLNAAPGEILSGLVLAILVMISVSLFTYGVTVTGLARPGRKGGMGILGAALAVLASFCP